MAMGRTREALGRVEHRWELDPPKSVINASVGMIRYLAHDYDGALVALRRGLEIGPTHYVSYLRMGLVCLQKNLPNEAIDAMQQAVMHSGGSTEALAGLAQAHAVQVNPRSNGAQGVPSILFRCSSELAKLACVIAASARRLCLRSWRSSPDAN
jgi:hypothetical protein